MREPLAAFIRREISGGFLMITCGLPGTGKSAAAARVRETTQAELIQSDAVRREVFKGRDVFSQSVAGDEAARLQVYAAMFRLAGPPLEARRSVILDATFYSRALRRQAAVTAAAHSADFIVLETVCPEAVSLARIRGRDKAISLSNAVTEAAYRSVARTWEPVQLQLLRDANPGRRLMHIVAETSAEQPYVVSMETR